MASCAFSGASSVTDEAALARYMGRDQAVLAHVVVLYAEAQYGEIHCVSEYRGTDVYGSPSERLRCVTVISINGGGRVLRLERRMAAGGWAGDWEVT